MYVDYFHESLLYRMNFQLPYHKHVYQPSLRCADVVRNHLRGNAIIRDVK